MMRGRSFAEVAMLIALASIIVPIALYICVRMAAAAWFNARREYDRWKLLRGEDREGKDETSEL